MRWQSESWPWANWRRWFAWRPVRLTGTDTIVWLEVVERQWRVPDGAPVRLGRWKYRDPLS